MQANPINKTKKVALIGTGLVGTSYAYSLLNQSGVCDELVLIDADKKRAKGEAMDLNHGLAFSNSNLKINDGSYSDCRDADIVTIAAGIAQKPGESRIDLLNRNADVFKTIIEPVLASGFSGVFLIATNPVDIMTYVTLKLSGFPQKKVIGSGTALDTARLRYLLGDYFKINPKNIHAYVLGEHGESEFVPWSQAKIATMPAVDYCKRCSKNACLEDMEKIALDVKCAAANIINAKGATYYAIGIALVRITRAILSDENSVLTVSCFPNGEYGLHNICLGLPAIVNQNGVKKIFEFDLKNNETDKLNRSHDLLFDIASKLNL